MEGQAGVGDQVQGVAVLGGSSVGVPSVTGTTPRSSSSAMAALPAMSRTWSW
ncbi:hypothetical protein LUX34_29105 [Streptomyces werraensis]|nr:hypothetical protein [Streptomyces werraensis]